MKTKVEICHIDSNRCVVRVSGIEEDQDLGSSLGEAADAEQAEDRARERLMERLLKTKTPTERKRITESPVKKQEQGVVKPHKDQQSATKNEQNQSGPSSIPPSQDQASQPKAVSGQITEQLSEPTAEQIQEPSEAPTDPDDWSEELTAIDLQLKRIGWTREHEHKYLERAYGHGSRHKLTRYSDLVSYLNKLKSLEEGAEAGAVLTPLRRSDLITQGDEMLTSLKWDQERAKSFLKSKLRATSRQQLSDEQLLEFNMFLEEELIALIS
ncbi:MAG: hypothetical protein QNK79_09375 [Synechococcus sp. ArSW.bin.68]